MRKALFSLVLFLLVAAHGASAQSNTPLILTINGDLWAWSGDAAAPPVSLTTWGYNDPGVISPDGSRIAYNSLASMVVDAFARVGNLFGGEMPSNIWVIDFSGNGIRVAEQPEGASFMSEGVADFGIIRSSPVWSPNGGQLLWAEQTYPNALDSLVIYDFATGSMRTIVANLPPSAGVIAPKDVAWGQSGIVMYDVQIGADGVMIDLFTLYSPDGAALSSFQVGGSGRFMVYWALMDDNGREVLGVLFNDSVWELYDLASGASQVSTGIPELFSTLNPAGSLALSPSINEAGGFTWRALSSDGGVVAEFLSASYFVPQRYALSPDGQAVAYSDFLEGQNVFSELINVWRGGVITVIPNPVQFPLHGGVQWAPLGWRVRAGVG
jgi:Tol biopolymer transport system component